MEARPQVRCPPSSGRLPRESEALVIPQPSRPPVPSPWLALSGPPVDCHGASSWQQEADTPARLSRCSESRQSELTWPRGQLQVGGRFQNSNLADFQLFMLKV